MALLAAARRLPLGRLAAAGAAAGAAWAVCDERRGTACAAAPAAPAAAAAAAPWQHAAAAPDARALPTFSLAEVAKHATPEARVWVTFRGGVYDITDFLANHPGGVDKIMTAAGGALEPFWALYRQHLQPARPGEPPVPKDAVAEFLAPLQVGWLDPAEAAAMAAARARSADDPYAAEPSRHPGLRVLNETPCNAETPAALFGEWVTPSALWFVRNHHPVPKLDAAAFTLEVGGQGGRPPVVFTMDDLRKMPSATVTATLQCGGNRRGDLNSVRKTSGNAWGFGAISNATWVGVRLRDVLAAAGVQAVDAEGRAVAHVQFEGEDGTKASIPVGKAVSVAGDVLLAYAMNGEDLPADHGYPLRAVVPGHVGVRNVKWLRKVVASHEEAEGVWQRGMAYKHFGPSVTSLEGVDVEAHASMQEMPVQSAIFEPSGSASRPASAAPGEELTVRGFAWSGGGRGIVRVDVSADGGETWRSARLLQGKEQPLDRAWAWTFWEVELPVGTQARSTSLVCKAVDAAHNSQPETPAAVWNLRGLANNSWHRVPIHIADDE